MSKNEYYAISEALELIIKLLIENENDVPLNCLIEYKKAKKMYIGSTLKLLGEIKDVKFQNTKTNQRKCKTYRRNKIRNGISKK